MSLTSRVLGRNALPSGPESTALTWTSISTDPRVFLLVGKPTIAFGSLTAQVSRSSPWRRGSSDHVTVRHGIDPAVPSASPDFSANPTGEAQQVGLARDTATGAAYALILDQPRRGAVGRSVSS